VALALWPTSRLKFNSAPPVLEKKTYRLNSFLCRFLPALAVWSIVTGMFSPFANVYFSQHLRVPLEHIGTIFSVSQFSQVIAILFAPLIFKKFGLVAGIMYTQIATALALFGLASVQSAGAASMVYVGFMAVQYMNEPGLFSLLMNEVPVSERSSASAWNFLVISAAQAVAAFVAGHAFARFGYPAVLTLTAVIALLAAFLFQLLLHGKVEPAQKEISRPQALAEQQR
jgi:MFS family permease